MRIMPLTKTLKPGLLVFLILQIQAGLFAQLIKGFTDIDESKVSAWKVNSASDYQAVYHFGLSEVESTLTLIVTDSKVYAQIRRSTFNDDGTAYIWIYENLTNVRIDGNKFYSDMTNGEFVHYDSFEPVNGLKVYDSWSGLGGSYEIGIRSHSVDKHYSGNFPKASISALTKEQLQKLNKFNLKVMRNEIFARYGYIFRSGGSMDNYFKSQSWYRPQHKNVDNFLTELEKKNIVLIQQFEKR